MAQTALDGGTIPNFVRGGLADGVIKMSPLGPGATDPARAQFEATKAEVLRGGFAALRGPLKDNRGNVFLGEGAIALGGPALALPRYAPGTRAPRHPRPGLETILVLEGAQSDDRGRCEAGALIVNAVGSEHSVWSEEGCVVLIQWMRPVEMLED